MRLKGDAQSAIGVKLGAESMPAFRAGILVQFRG